MIKGFDVGRLRNDPEVTIEELRAYYEARDAFIAYRVRKKQPIHDFITLSLLRPCDRWCDRPARQRKRDAIKKVKK